MAWVKLDDRFCTNHKILGAGLLASGLYVRGLSYCGLHSTDGFIPSAALGVLGSGMGSSRIKSVVSRLEMFGLWIRSDGGWTVNDFLDYNPTRSTIESQREAAKLRMRNVRANQREQGSECSREQQRTPPDRSSRGRARSPARPVPLVSSSKEDSSEAVAPDAAKSTTGDTVNKESKSALKRWNDLAGQKLTWKTWGPKIKPRVREHGAAAVLAVFEWYFAGQSDKSVFLRNGGYGMSTLIRRSNFEVYLEEARREFGGSGAHESAADIERRHHKQYGYGARPGPEMALLESARQRESRP